MSSFSFAELNLLALAPQLFCIIGALLILGVDLCLKAQNKHLYTTIAMLSLFFTFGGIIAFGEFGSAFFDLVVMDNIALYSQILILIAALLFLPLSLTSQKIFEFSHTEFYALFLFMIAGFMFMLCSFNLIVIFLGLEIGSLSLYTLIALHNRTRSFEAAFKYFTTGALAAACFAFGSALLYAASGSLDLSEIYMRLSESESLPYHLILCSAVFFLASIGFKGSLVPFHAWTPDVYEGSTAFMAGFMSIVPKIAAFCVALRIFTIFSEFTWFFAIFYALVIITMTYPNLVALVQSDVKRMLAYSSISHAGFGFGAVLIGGEAGFGALFVYWGLFLFTNLGAFAMLWLFTNKDNRYCFENFSGLVKTNPIAAVIMGLFMLSLAGIPPLSIFWGKVYLMSLAFSGGFLLLAIFIALNSAISAYYYLKLIVFMFLKEPQNSSSINSNANAINFNTETMATLPLKIVLFIAVFATIFAMVFMEFILNAPFGF